MKTSSLEKINSQEKKMEAGADSAAGRRSAEKDTNFIAAGQYLKSLEDNKTMDNFQNKINQLLSQEMSQEASPDDKDKHKKLLDEINEMIDKIMETHKKLREAKDGLDPKEDQKLLDKIWPKITEANILINKLKMEKDTLDAGEEDLEKLFA